MQIINIELGRLRAIYRELPGYIEGQTFVDFLTSSSGKDVKYLHDERCYQVTFHDDGEALQLHLDYLSMDEDSFWIRIHEEDQARAAKLREGWFKDWV